jgi:hypothetical protein
MTVSQYWVARQYCDSERMRSYVLVIMATVGKAQRTTFEDVNQQRGAARVTH